MSVATRSKTQMYLLGDSVAELTGSKLPSLRMALGLFLYHHIDLKETVRQSSSVTVNEIAKFWQKARIPMREHRNCHTKLEQSFEEWRLLKKNKGRKTATQQAREDSFISRLDDLFDLAHANAVSMINIQEDKDFLFAQREKGRRGSMAGLDLTLTMKEKRAAERKRKLDFRRQQMEDQDMQHIQTATESCSSSEEDSLNVEIEDESAAGAVGGTTFCTPAKRKRGTKSVVTPGLAAALDRTKLSDRKAAFVIAETARSLGQNIDNLALNRDSIRRQRQEHRAQRSASLKAEFRVQIPLVVHWDGKLIPDLTGKEKVDRLPVLVSGKGVSQLLTVAKLPSGTGEAQASAVFGAIEDWNITTSIRAMCFDTTSSNTGRIAGACVLLEQKLGKELLYFACRHHIMELIIGAVFQVCMGSTSAPEVLLFKRFQEKWGLMDTDRYETGMASDVADLVEDIRESTIEFCNKNLQQSQPRDDYREFLELVIIFLGSVPERGIRFMSPGAMHHARWMSKVIYSLKIWMFRHQFKLTLREQLGLRDVCVFTVRIYLKIWITAPLAASAPYSDLMLMKSLLKYLSIHPAIAKATSIKLSNHLWYLSPELVGLAFFDDQVSSTTKRLMASAMQNEDLEQDHTKRLSVPMDVLKNKNLEDFVTAKSMKFFSMMELPDGFLNVDPELWDERDDFKQATEMVKSLKVVNDHAERGVALIQEYSGLITRDESQLQFLLQVVEEHRRAYPDSRKQTLAKKPAKE